MASNRWHPPRLPETDPLNDIHTKSNNIIKICPCCVWGIGISEICVWDIKSGIATEINYNFTFFLFFSFQPGTFFHSSALWSSIFLNFPCKGWKKRVYLSKESESFCQMIYREKNIFRTIEERALDDTSKWMRILDLRNFRILNEWSFTLM